MASEIADVPLVGTWWRHARRRADAVSLPGPETVARWQRGWVVRALYLADSRETMWAEFYRAAAELETPPNRLMPRNVWQLAVDLGTVADLSSDEALAAVGLPPPEPTSEQWPAYQAVGERLHAEGLQGILWRSAARPRGLSACIFEPALTGVQAAADPELVSELPATPRGLRT